MYPALERHSLLSEALDIRPREIIALSGAGGKTSLMFQLAGEIAAHSVVLTTTTTKIAVPDPSQSPCCVLTRDDPQWELHSRIRLQELRHITLAHHRFGDTKLKGHEGEEMEELLRRELAPYILIEADGARQKPLKAPRHDEPLIPRQTTLVVGMIGWDVLGKELAEPNVHRAEIFRRTLGLAGDRLEVTADIIARWAAHPAGLGKNVPAGARFVAFLNKCDLEAHREEAGRLASAIVCSPGSSCRHVVVGSIRQKFFLSVRDAGCHLS